MASTIVKGLTVAAGLGLVIGLGAGNRRAEENGMGTKSPDEGAPVPVLQRLGRIESRIAALESRPQATASDLELDLRIQAQAKQIETLQLRASEHRGRVAGEIAEIEKRFTGLAGEIPAVLESIIAPRVETLHAHLRTEIQQSVGATLARFERAINDKISDRMAHIEKSVRDQSSAVNALSRRAVESDANVQRLVAAVERLAERGTPNLAPREPSFLELPLKGQTSKAAEPQPETPTPAFESGFRPRIIKEEDDTSGRHRRPMARL
jgi:hypothetical protein